MNRLDLVRDAGQYGLVLRGGFGVSGDDGVPDIGEGTPARSLVLFGNAGSSIWPTFSGSPEYADGEPDPLNRWSERIGRELAARWRGLALFPFGGPPYQPFLRWAGKAEGLRSSRLGMLLHPDYGLWHAYRFAIAFAEPVDGLEAQPAPAAHACDTCREQPCLSVCPVDAFDGERYAVEACFRYLQAHPDSPCRRACRARDACPEGAGYRYDPDHAAFHMTQFFISQCAQFD